MLAASARQPRIGSGDGDAWVTAGAIGDDVVRGPMEGDDRHRRARGWMNLLRDQTHRGEDVRVTAGHGRRFPGAERKPRHVHPCEVDAVPALDRLHERHQESVVRALGAELPVAAEGVRGDGDHSPRRGEAGEVGIHALLERVRVRTVEIQDQCNRPVLVIGLGNPETVRTLNPSTHERERHVTGPLASQSSHGRALTAAGASRGDPSRRGASDSPSCRRRGGATGHRAEQHEESDNCRQPGPTRTWGGPIQVGAHVEVGSWRGETATLVEPVVGGGGDPRPGTPPQAPAPSSMLTTRLHGGIGPIGWRRHNAVTIVSTELSGNGARRRASPHHTAKRVRRRGSSTGAQRTNRTHNRAATADQRVSASHHPAVHSSACRPPEGGRAAYRSSSRDRLLPGCQIVLAPVTTKDPPPGHTAFAVASAASIARSGSKYSSWASSVRRMGGQCRRPERLARDRESRVHRVDRRTTRSANHGRASSECRADIHLASCRSNGSVHQPSGVHACSCSRRSLSHHRTGSPFASECSRGAGQEERVSPSGRRSVPYRGLRCPPMC